MTAQMPVSPTKRTYDGLQRAYEHFNRTLFDGELPECLITLQRKRGAYGYFWSKTFADPAASPGVGSIDEIALNPRHFDEGPEQILSTLVHEMAHLWQEHFGKPSPGGYHNEQWARKMMSVGLFPSHTGRPGGKTTGRRVSHYVIPKGAFRREFDVIQQGVEDFYQDVHAPRAGTSTAKNKIKYSCPACALNAWGKPGIRLMCVECGWELLDPTDTLNASYDATVACEGEAHRLARCASPTGLR